MQKQADRFSWIFAILLAAGIATVCLSFNPRFFFHDDNEVQYLPAYLEMGRILDLKQLPIITSRSWFGGNFLGEYQFSVMNPVQLFLCWAIYQMPQSLVFKVTFLSLFYLFIFVLGVDFFARQLKLTFRSRLLLLTLLTLNHFLLFWYAISWFPGFIAMAWFFWAAGYLIKVQKHPTHYPLQVLFFYLVFSVGFPYVSFPLAVTTLCLVFYSENLFASFHPPVIFKKLANNLKANKWLVAGLITAILLCAPATLYMERYMMFAERATWHFSFKPADWRVPLEVFFGMFLPSYFAVWCNFDGAFELANSPIIYTGWLLLPLLYLGFKKGNAFKTPALPFLLLSVFFLVLATSPMQGQIRYPVRFLIFAQFFLAIYAVKITDGVPLTFTKKELAILGGLFTVLTFLAFSASPAFVPEHAIHLILIFVGLASLYRAREFRQLLYVLLVNACGLGITLAFHPTNSLVPDYGIARAKPYHSRNDEHSMFLFSNTARYMELTAPDWWSHMVVGNTFLYTASLGRAVNGYSPVCPKALLDTFCLNYLTHTCPQISRFLFSNVGYDRLRFIDVLGINRVVAETLTHGPEFAKWKTKEWKLTAKTPSFEVFEKEGRQPGMDINSYFEIVGSAGHDVRILDLKESRWVFEIVFAKPSPQEMTVVFHRAYFPGFHATLDDQPTPIETIRDLVPVIRIPAHTKATKVVLEFTPKELRNGYRFAGAGLILLLGLSLGLLRSRRRH